MTVDALYKYILFVAKKNQAGGIKKDDFESAYNAQQKGYFSELAEQYKSLLLRRLPPEQNEILAQKLSPFRLFDQSLTFANGNVVKPADLVKLESLRYNGKEVVFISNDKLSSALNDPIDPPDANGTVYVVDAGTKYQIYPNSITTGVKIDYLRTPKNIVWNHTTDGDGRYIYTAAGSVDPEWDDISAIEIAGRALKELGVSFEDSMLFQYGEMVRKEGN